MDVGIDKQHLSWNSGGPLENAGPSYSTAMGDGLQAGKPFRLSRSIDSASYPPWDDKINRAD